MSAYSSCLWLFCNVLLVENNKNRKKLTICSYLKPQKLRFCYAVYDNIKMQRNYFAKGVKIMSKKLKTFLAVVLALFMLVSTVTSAFAAEEESNPLTIDVSQLSSTYIQLGSGKDYYCEDGYILTGTNTSLALEISQDCNVTLDNLNIHSIYSYTSTLTLKGDNCLSYTLDIYENSMVTVNGGESDILTVTSTAYALWGSSGSTFVVNGGKLCFETTTSGAFNTFSIPNFTLNSGEVTVKISGDSLCALSSSNICLNGGKLNIDSKESENGCFYGSITMKSGALLTLDWKSSEVMTSNSSIMCDESSGVENAYIFAKLDGETQFLPTNSPYSALKNKTHAEFKVDTHSHTLDKLYRCECGYICSHMYTTDNICYYCGEYAYSFTHQPTVAEPYVKLNDDTNAKYQWYTAKREEVVLTDENVTPVESRGVKSTYSTSNGWTGVPTYIFNDDFAYQCFGAEFKAGDVITVEAEKEIGSISFKNIESYDGWFSSENSSTAVFAVPFDGIYYLSLSENVPVTVSAKMYTFTAIDGETSATLSSLKIGKNYLCKATVNTSRVITSDLLDNSYKIIHNPTEKEPYVTLNNDLNAKYQWYKVTGEDNGTYTIIEGETSARLSSVKCGKKYVCKVTTNNGAVLTSEIFTSVYKITHQPTEYETFVELNDNTNAKYQWNKVVVEDDVKVDTTNAEVYTYGSDSSSYDPELGWKSVRGYYFKIDLKAGQVIHISTQISSPYPMMFFNINTSEQVYQYPSNRSWEFTASKDGKYLLYAPIDCSYINAYIVGETKYTPIDGETSAKLKTEQLGTYCCDVTFEDGTKERSETVKTTNVFNPVSELRLIRSTASIDKNGVITLTLKEGKNAIGVYKKTKSGYDCTVTSDNINFVLGRTDAFVAYDFANSEKETGKITFTLSDGTTKEYNVIFKFRDFDPIKELRLIRSTASIGEDGVITLTLEDGKNAIGVYNKTSSGYGCTITSDDVAFDPDRDDAFVAYACDNGENGTGEITFTLSDGTTKQYTVKYKFRDFDPIKELKTIRSTASLETDENGEYILVKLLEGKNAAGVYVNCSSKCTCSITSENTDFANRNDAFVAYVRDNEAKTEETITFDLYDGRTETYRIVFDLT